ncbi:MAG: GMP synthase [Deltaproteobacteria bacterium]|nr:GMP synthase [Deltaproteobacteria bacterium]
MKIGLLQCDHVADELAELHGDVPDLFLNLFRRAAKDLPFDVSIDIFNVMNGEYPDLSVPHGNGYDGFIGSGSRFSVYDQIDWILAFKKFVKKLFAAEKKFVGICFGHQMIAEALGGACGNSARGWGLGTREVVIRRPMPWMKPALNAYRLIVSHADQVDTLPPNAEILGGNDHCPCSMYMAGSHFLGIQGHPEFTPAFAEDLMISRLERLGAKVIDDAVPTLKESTDEIVIAKWILNFFR